MTQTTNTVGGEEMTNNPEDNLIINTVLNFFNRFSQTFHILFCIYRLEEEGIKQVSLPTGGSNDTIGGHVRLWQPEISLVR